MPSNFPSNLDQFDPVPRSQQIAVKHHERHQNVEDAVEAIEAYVGTSTSTDPNSLTYKVLQFLSSAGSSLIGFIQAGVGAVFRTSQAKMREFTTPQDFGAVADGVTDDSVALQRAINKAMADGYCGIRVPAGVYLLNQTVSASLSGLMGFSLVGDGPDLTEFRVNVASGNGLAFSSTTGNWWLNTVPHNPVVISGITVSTTKTGVGTGISFNMGSLEGRPAPGVVLRDVILRGHNSFFHYFATAVDFLDTTEVRCSNVRVVQGGPGNVVGVAFNLRGSGPTTDPTSLKFTDCEVVFGQYGWQIGNYVEGVYLTQCDAINTVSKVYHHTTTGESGLHVIGGHANTSGPCYDLDGVFDHTIANVLMYSSSGSATWRGIKARNGGSGTYTGNIMRAGAVAGEIGIDIDSVPNEALHGYTISGNHFANIDSAGVLGAAARKVRWANDNQYLNCPNRIQNLAPTANANYVEGFRFEGIVTVNTVGGAQSETIDIPLPAGRFLTKPSYGLLSSASQDAVGFYVRTDVNSTATNARCRLWKISGNLGAGPNEISVMFGE